MVAFAMLIEIVFCVLAANCTGVSDKAIFMTLKVFLEASYPITLGWLELE